MRIEEVITFFEDEKEYYEKASISRPNKRIDAYKMAIDALNKLEQKKGKWIEDGYVGWYPTCSYCGYNAPDKTNFCSNCRARMQKEE